MSRPYGVCARPKEGLSAIATAFVTPFFKTTHRIRVCYYPSEVHDLFDTLINVQEIVVGSTSLAKCIDRLNERGFSTISDVTWNSRDRVDRDLSISLW